MSTDLERNLLSYILAIYDQRILTGPGGRINRHLYKRQNGRAMLAPQGGFIGTSAAHLALTSVEGNPHHGREDLLDLAMDAADRLVLDTQGVGRDYDKPDHFVIYPLVRIYELTAEHAGKARRSRWREALARNHKAVLDLIGRSWPNLGRAAPWAGTGPNHYFGWFSVGRDQARLLGDDDAIRKIDRAFLKHLKIQTPAGYFPEHIGPVVAYQHVSLGGVAEYHRQHPRPITADAVERGVAYMVRAIYPDGRGLDTFDQRNRLGNFPRLQPALAWTGQGRTLLARYLTGQHERLLKEGIGRGVEVRRDPWMLGSAFRCYEHVVATRELDLKAKPLPIDRKRFTWRLEDKGLVRKEGPWFYALSAWENQTCSGNPYHFERTQMLSVYHNAAGLIIGGGNDKRSYHAATIHLLEGGEVHYFPPLEGKLSVGVTSTVLSKPGRCDRLTFDYGAAIARLEVRCESDCLLRVGLAIETTMTDAEMALVLQMPIKAPLTLANGQKRLRLPAAKQDDDPKATPLARSLALPGAWKLGLPTGASLIWPHLPWNAYRPPTYRVEPEEAVALVRVPLAKRTGKAEVTIRAGQLR